MMLGQNYWVINNIPEKYLAFSSFFQNGVLKATKSYIVYSYVSFHNNQLLQNFKLQYITSYRILYLLLSFAHTEENSTRIQLKLLRNRSRLKNKQPHGSNLPTIELNKVRTFQLF